MPELSVHLITYNNEKHIEETLLSILKQKVSFTYEIVVGDDCSTDKTLNIINSYALAQPNIFKVTKNKTQLGILGNFKSTLDRCSGSYIFDIAGDDMLKTDNALQKMVEALQRDSSIGFVDSGYDRLDDKYNSITHFKNKAVISATKNEYKKHILLGKIAPTGHCYNRECLYKYVDFDSYLKMQITIEDYPILVDMIMHTSVARINESLHTYRAHDNSYSHKKDFGKLVFQKQEMKKLFEYFSNKYTFSKQLAEAYFENYNKELLFLAGYFKNNVLGKEMFTKINSKSPRDFIHYYASQYGWIRSLIVLRKRISNLS